MGHVRDLCLLMPFCFILFFHDLDGTDLWSAHEARAAQNAQRMLDDHSFGLPRLYDGQLDLQKPPAFYWLVAGVASLRDGVVDRCAVRLPAAISGLLTVLMLYAFLTQRKRPLAGLMAGLVLAGTIHFTSAARTGRIDMVMTAAVTAVMLLLYPKSDSGYVKPLLRSILAGLAFAAALLLKGPVAAVLPVAALLVWFGLQWKNRTLQKGSFVLLSIAVLLGSLLAVPWFLWANEQTQGQFWRVFFWYHNFERAMGDSPALAVHPWWFYGPRFAIDFLPWTPLLIAAAVYFVRNRSKNNGSEATFGLLWLLTMVLLLSFSRFKRADYLLPAFPGAALFAGCIVERWHQHIPIRWRKRGTVAFFTVSIATLAAWAWFHRFEEPKQEAVREQEGFALHIRQLAPVPETILLFRVESHLLAYHLHRPLHTLVEWGELNNRLADPGTHWFVTRAEYVPECLQNIRSRRVEVVAHSEGFSRSVPLRPFVLMRTTIP